MKTSLSIAVFFLIACSQFTNEGGEFEAALKKWQDSGSQSYEYQSRISCYCRISQLGTYLVVVEDDVVKEVLDPVTRERIMVNWVNPDSSEYVLKAAPDAFHTINDLFDIIDRAQKNKADDMKVEYDSTFGFPLEISIDYYKEAIDDEIGYISGSYEPK